MKNSLSPIVYLGALLFSLGPLAVSSADLPLFVRSEAKRPQINIEIANSDFEEQGGWVQADGSPFKPTNVCSSGKQACRLDGGMVKTALIPLNPGEEFFFSAQTKVDNLRVIEAETSFFDADGNWLREGSGSLARGDQYSWQQINGRFLNSRSDVFYVALQFYGAGELDDVKVWKLSKAADNGDQTRARQNIDLPRESNENYFFVVNDNFEAWISRKTGLLIKLVSLKPTPKVIQPAGQNSMQLYLQSEAAGIDGDFSRLVKMESPDSSTLICLLTSSDPKVAALADVRLTYTFLPERLDIKADYLFKKDDSRSFQFGLRNVFRANEWQDCIYPTFPVSKVSADQQFRVSFYYTPGDHTVKNMTSQLPFSFLESDDRFLAWGSLDLGNFNVLTANDIEWRLPSMQLGSDMLKAGTTRTFNSFYAVFPKANHELTQVMRYCVDNLYSSHPLMKDLIAGRDREPRYFTQGAFAWYHPGAVPPGCDGWRQDMIDRHAENVWYSWWANWTEECFIEGDWFTYDCRHLSAKGMKEEIEYMQGMGLNVYLYFRQFLAENGTHEDHAPYKKWLGRDEEGRRQAFIDFPVPNPQALGGEKEVRWTMADFGQQDCREWYVDMVKKCIDFYRPKGLAWDMGFSSMYSNGAPDVGLGNGTIYIQGVIYDYLKEKYPDMRIAMNEAFCSPAAFFGDCIMIEGAWDVAKKSELDYQMAKGFGKTLFSLQLIDDYLIQLAPYFDASQYTHVRCKIRAEGLSEATLFYNHNLFDSNFVANGEWQTIEMPVKFKGFRTLEIGIRTGDTDNGYLDIAEIELISEKSKITPLKVMNANVPAEDFVTSRKWYNREPGIGKVENIDGALRVSVDGVSKSYDTFSITTVKDKWLKNNLRVLALGAICSDAQIPARKELNEFSAELSAMRHLSDRKLIYGNPVNVYGTFWARDAKCAGAIYNESDRTENLKIQLDRAAFPDNGAALENGNVTLKIVDSNGIFHDADNFKLTPQNDNILLTGKLPAGTLLVVYNW